MNVFPVLLKPTTAFNGLLLMLVNTPMSTVLWAMATIVVTVTVMVNGLILSMAIAVIALLRLSMKTASMFSPPRNREEPSPSLAVLSTLEQSVILVITLVNGRT